MSQFALRNPGETSAESYSGARTYVLPFYIENVLPGQIEWTTPGMPPKFDPHPNHPSALARSKLARRHGDSGGSVVMVRYTTPEIRNLHTPPPEPEPLTQHALIWDVTFHDVVIGLPIARIEEVTQPDTAGTGTVVVALRWTVRWERVREARTVLRVRWRLNSPSIADASILAQHYNRIHQLPDGKLWRFTASNLVARSTTEYEAVAQWELDTGSTLRMFQTSGPLDPKQPGNLTYATGHEPNAGLSRNPYHSLMTTQAPDNGNPMQPDPPILWHTTTYTDNPSLYNSWKTGEDQLPQFPGF